VTDIANPTGEVKTSNRDVEKRCGTKYVRREERKLVLRGHSLLIIGLHLHTSGTIDRDFWRMEAPVRA
jgi:hypothetical protein